MPRIDDTTDPPLTFDFFRAIELLREEYGVRPVFFNPNTGVKQSPWPDGVWLVEVTGDLARPQDSIRRFIFAYNGQTPDESTVNAKLFHYLNRYVSPEIPVKVNETVFTVEQLMRLIHKADMILQWECL